MCQTLLMRSRGTTLPLSVLLVLVVLAATPPLAAVAPPPLRGTGGAVASEDPRATQVGLAVLSAGGNAVDAAVATALALAVVFPEAGNLGGGGFAVVKMGEEVTALDFRETAPAAAHRTMFLDEKGERIPDASIAGPLAAGVPGSPAGLHELHRRHGRLPWSRVVQPAVALATGGFVVTGDLHDVLVREKKLLARFPETASLWLPGGEPLAPGTTLRLPDLAATLTLYSERGPAGITEGPAAAAIEAISRAYGGVLRASDLAAYRPVWREPVRFSALGWDFATMGLPSSGGVVLGETLGALERLGWRDLPRGGADRSHLLAESLRRAFADRSLLGDPATTGATPAALLAPRRLDALAAAIDRARATPSAGVTPWAGDQTAAPAAAAVARPSIPEPADTTHLSVVDAEGNLVALTTTINDLFGCGLYVPGAGFFLNDEMDDFVTAPGRPNLNGLVMGEANAIAPGKRMLSSMTPVVAWRGGEALALGGRGGGRIPTSVVQAVLALLVDGDTLTEALSHPRLHHQWLPDRLEAETDALAPETRTELERRGHTVVAPRERDRAKLAAVRRRGDGTVEAAIDPRGAAARSGAGVVAPLP